MDISPRDRFLGIYRFKRPGDLFTFSSFCPEMLEEWVKQDAPKEIIVPRFLYHYFQFDHRHSLTQAKSGIGTAQTYQPSGLGCGITRWQRTPVVPSDEPRITLEDERNVTFTNGDNQTLRVFEDTPTSMPMYLDWPVKDRVIWNKYKKRLDPNTPARWPSDWKAYVQEINKLGEEVPISLDVGGFYSYLRETSAYQKEGCYT